MELDRQDTVARDARQVEFDSWQGPRVGDFVILPGGGEVRRFSHRWPDAIQTTCGDGDGSFYMGRDGLASYSGSLEPGIPLPAIQDTGKRLYGAFWFFHHEHMRAHNGVNVMMACRVYRVGAAEIQQAGGDC